jgi:hypothetical protein
MRAMIVLATLAVGLPGAAQAASAGPQTYIYCSAPSTSPRGAGLIITAIFPSRLDPKFIEIAFTNYLHNSYASYGNGWIFKEGTPSCASFRDKDEAQYRRRLDISRIPQPAQSIFNVTFVM